METAVLPSLMRCEDLSDVVKIPTSTLFTWARQGKIPHFRLNGLVRFDPAEIREWLRGQHQAP